MPVWENDGLSRDEAIRIAAIMAAAESSKESVHAGILIRKSQQIEKYIRSGEFR